MMHMPPLHLLLNLIGAGVLLIATIPYAVNFIQGIISNKHSLHDGDTYKDEDGVATEESQEKLRVKTQNILLLLATLAGVGSSLAQFIFSLTNGDLWAGQGRIVYGPIQFGIWVLLLIQALAIVRNHDSIMRYDISIITSFCYVLELILVCISNWSFLGGIPKSAKVDVAICIAQAILALMSALVCTLYPRRPQVYYEGSIVDGQWTVSAYNRFTYTWPGSLLAISASGQKPLQIEDLPKLDHGIRAKDLHDNNLAGNQGSLIRLILRSHAAAFTRQIAFTVVHSTLIMTPQYAMYRLLRELEARDQGASVSITASLWVVGLGLTMLVTEFLEQYMWWVSYGQLNVPVRVQLSALVFNKSMRRKDVKGASGSEEDNKNVNDAIVEVGPTAETPEEGKGPGTEPEENIQKTRQGTINLVGIDAKRVADFTTYNSLIYGAIIKIAIAFAFLARLIGWQGLLAGIAVQVITLPVNLYATKVYSSSQDDLMKMRDRKLAVLSEALNGIRQIKFSALEREWHERIRQVRGKELDVQWRVFMSDTVLIFCWLIGPVLLSAASIGVYAIINGGLSASVAFTTISILSNIEGTLAYVPELTTDALDALVSIRRIEEYLKAPEKLQNTLPGEVVAFKNATVSWPSDEEDKNDESFKLRNVNVEFPNGELSVISGRTGAGKSLMLAAILGEVEILEGSVTVPTAPQLHERFDDKANRNNWILPSAIAYVSQIPWIENATLKDNVLFGLPFDPLRYKKVISACALEKDLEILEDGDQTEIGAQGINLSGGQRWRVTLSRALYSRAGILVLDDIFSAVDAHVGRQIFEEALTGDLCEGRTRILVTHHVSLCLPKTKYEVRLENGKVEFAGTPEELREVGALERIISQEDEEVAVQEEDVASELPELSKVRSRRRSSHLSGRLETEEQQGNGRPALQQRRSSAVSARSHPNGTAHNAKQQPRKFVEEEKRETGRVKWSVYGAYFQASGGAWFWAAAFVLFAGYQALMLGRSWWLRLWTRSYETDSFLFNVQNSRFAVFDPVPNTQGIQVDPELRYYLVVYIIISVVMCLYGTLRYLWIFFGSIRASRKMFDELTLAVLHAPLRWLDIVPVGRILNRFTADFNVIDSTMANAFGFMFFNFFMIAGILVAGGPLIVPVSPVIVSPYVLIFAGILLAICVRYALYYLAGARDTKRLESTAKSPVFELFSAALAGVTSIRAFGKTETYIKNMYERIDAHSRAYYYMWLFNRWLSWRLGVIGALFAVVMAGLIVAVKSIDASLGGFALGFVLQYTESVIWVLRQYANVELGMNATERIKEYTEIATEAEGGADAPAAWPTEGRLSINDLVVGYAPDLPPVLRGLTFEVERNQRIGVVGRTGAGKSSLTLALFRFLEAREGSIHIDGLDISTIKLHDLRSRLAIIPQDPVLFSGTVRSNIDPFNQHEDYELKDALERVHLVSESSRPGTAGTSTVNSDDNGNSNVNVFKSLTSSISEGGLNLSQGQRQLLCLARAIIARPKIMVLDEATSAVDKATDELIQRSIREQFSDSTLIVIAHRLSTIADFDRILVMSAGKVAEYDTPKKLMEKEGGLFKGMVEDSGEKDVLRKIILGEGDE